MKIVLTAENAEVNKYCMEAQADEIYGPQVLDYFSTDELEELMPLWAKALRVDGKITIGGTELFILCKNAVNRNKELAEINNILFGRTNAIKSITSIESTKEFLSSLGFTISNVNLNYESCLYSVEAYKE
jgi:hypothetical protein